MSAGGGAFVTQNKVLPGAYINFVSKARALGSMGERGIVAMPFVCNWGKNNEIIEISSEEFQKNMLYILGYSYTDDEMLYLREVFKGASSVLLYRISSGTKASAKIGSLSVNAKYNGTRGNDIGIVIEESVDGGGFYVRTVIGEGNIQVDEQKVSKIADLVENDFVIFSGDGDLTATARTSLSGATDTAPTGEAYSEFLNKVEGFDFTTILYSGEDEVTKSLFESFVKRLRNDEGYKISCVLQDYNGCDFEGIISVKNSVEEDIYGALVYWVAGQTAGAEVNQSLTNRKYDGEFSIKANYKKSELKEFIKNGDFVFFGERGVYKVLRDINTFISFTANKNSDFANNQVIRVLDAIANDTARIFDEYYLGKVQNDEIGRDLFKAELINYHEQLQGLQAITNFSAEDITVTKGAEKGDVVVMEYVEPVASMEKIYMTCIVE